MLCERIKKGLIRLIDFKTIMVFIITAMLTWYGTKIMDHERILTERTAIVSKVETIDHDMKNILIKDIPELHNMLTRIETKQEQQIKNINLIAEAISDISESKVYISNAPTELYNYVIDAEQ